MASDAQPKLQENVEGTELTEVERKTGKWRLQYVPADPKKLAIGQYLEVKSLDIRLALPQGLFCTNNVKHKFQPTDRNLSVINSLTLFEQKKTMVEIKPERPDLNRLYLTTQRRKVQTQ